MAEIHKNDFDKQFSKHLEAELNNQIRMFCVERLEEISELFAAELREKIKSISAQAAIRLFNQLELAYDRNALVIKIICPEPPKEGEE